jgi:hypothetical protein
MLLAGVAHAQPADVFVHPLTSVQTSALLGPAARSLTTATGLSGRFEQRKYLRELPQPLVSTGEFLFARDIGVWWHTQTPFDSVFILTREGARSRDEGGTVTRIGTADQPGVTVATRIFFALFALDFDVLSKDFDIYGTPRDDGWQIGLRPKSAAMSAVFREAVIDGARYAHKIELRDAQGDRTEILLPEVNVLTKGLTPADRQRFST